MLLAERVWPGWLAAWRGGVPNERSASRGPVVVRWWILHQPLGRIDAFPSEPLGVH